MIGQVVSHYRILAPLGRGGMGVVYEAEDMRLGRHVALKLLTPEACCDPVAMERFMREARLISTLSHPHICTLHDIGEHDGEQFMVMELLEGESLKDRIARGPLTPAEVRELGAQIADALAAAHQAGIIHRDIKPANLFITRRGQAKVLDFGVAKLEESREAQEHARTVAASELTTAGGPIGTIAYMSPEQARGEELDGRSDLFSLGAVLYEMATGRPAFPGTTQAAVFEGIFARTPRMASEVNPAIPADLATVIARAIEKNRDQRVQTAASLRAELMADTAPAASGSVTPAASDAHPRRRMLFIGAPLVMTAAIGAVIWQAQATPALAERDTVVLADFRNRTGDAVFDDTLGEVLALQLRQSPYLNLLPDPQVQATLQLMGREANDPLTPEVAREVCQRAAAQALLTGTIANVGNSFVLTLAAEDCREGRVLAEEQAVADGKNQVIAALGDTASAFREKLGESLASVQRYDQRIEQATTRSLEALKAYSQGMTTRRTQGDFEAVPFFRRAVEIDPDFALAHARLGTVLSNLGHTDDAKAASRRAYELREQVSARERLYIEARYHSVEGDVAQAINAYRLLLATYPDDFAAHSNVGGLYRTRGQMDQALHHLEEAVRLAPTQPLGYLNLGGAYFDAGRFDAARKAWEEVLALQDHVGARTSLVTLGIYTGDDALAATHLAAEPSTPLGRVEMAGIAARAASHRGQLRESSRRASDLFRLMSDQHWLREGSEVLLGLAIGQALTGRLDDARAQRERLVAAGQISESAGDELLALAALLGEAKEVTAATDRTIARMQANAPPEEHARIERAMRAIEAYAGRRYADAYRLSAANGTDFVQSKTVFLTGLSALALERWDDAARAFQTYIEFGPRLGLTVDHAIARIMLARAHAGAGRASEARRAYEDAFRIWKDADPDLPLLAAARREYERLAS